VNDEDETSTRKPKGESKQSIIPPLDLIQTCTMIKPNKIKGAISRIKAKPPSGINNPTFNLLKPKWQRLN